jgi:hypothetical protein
MKDEFTFVLDARNFALSMLKPAHPKTFGTPTTTLCANTASPRCSACSFTVRITTWLSGRCCDSRTDADPGEYVFCLPPDVLYEELLRYLLRRLSRHRYRSRAAAQIPKRLRTRPSIETGPPAIPQGAAMQPIFFWHGIRIPSIVGGRCRTYIIPTAPAGCARLSSAPMTASSRPQASCSAWPQHTLPMATPSSPASQNLLPAQWRWRPVNMFRSDRKPTSSVRI